MNINIYIYIYVDICVTLNMRASSTYLNVPLVSPIEVMELCAGGELYDRWYDRGGCADG